MRLFILIIAVGGMMTAGPARPLDEYQVKAAFLYNFAKFVEWPAESFQGPDDPITICVLGLESLGHELDMAVKGKAIAGRPLLVRRIVDTRQANGCRILFVRSPDRKRLSPIFAGVARSGVLTVGEADDSDMTGAIINFTSEKGKLRFEVDMDAAEREKLRFSSKLLSLARVMKK